SRCLPDNKAPWAGGPVFPRCSEPPCPQPAYARPACHPDPVLVGHKRVDPDPDEAPTRGSQGRCHLSDARRGTVVGRRWVESPRARTRGWALLPGGGWGPTAQPSVPERGSTTADACPMSARFE